MIEITFKHLDDVKKLKKLIHHKFYHVEWKVNDNEGINEYLLVIGWKKPFNNSRNLKKLQMLFFQYILNNKCDDWTKEILAKQYFFKDETEQRHIVEIMHSLIEGKREELENLVHDVDIEACLTEAIEEIFQGDVSFSFDSFVTFRLRTFMEVLKKYIEISIDEYKMEQEYQVFIQTLRDFLSDRVSKKQTIHVLLDLDIQFYDEHYREMTQQDIMMMWDKKLFAHQSVYIDPFSIGPLLSLAPNKIYLYTEDREQPIVRTIVNIFEERVQILGKQDFFQDVSILSRRFEQK
ncbi:putative sporulation protein YtxC [Niallia sp. 01092]|uniref:putative sporulation protein YtxC n=1 Tax=unclassified Niallia TaxID=2837522 RepID=UPI003FD49600